MPATNRTLPTGGLVNPSMVLDGRFVTIDNEQPWTTSLALADHPDIARWLISFVDYFLYKQGKTPGPKGISEPPRGQVLQDLIKGKVILTEERPGGELVHRLNPNLGVWLGLRLRLHGEPARETLVALVEQPEVARWLLMREVEGAPGPESPPPGDELLAALRELGILVDTLPPEEIHFPDPKCTTDLAQELASAERVIHQPAGQDIPPEVVGLLGRNLPPIPGDIDLVWGVDAGTGLVFPSCGVVPGGSERVARLAGSTASQRRAFWDRQRQSARQALDSREYVELRQIIPAGQQTRIRHFARELVNRGYFPALGSDGWFERRAVLQNPPGLSSIHSGLAALLSDALKEPLIPSFCQLGVYEAGAVLEKHLDRPQCIYNLSLVLDMMAGPEGLPAPWPIYFEVGGQAVGVDLEVGDGVVYSGVKTWHWRTALPAGQRAIVFFLFFVPPDFQGTLH